MARLVTVLTEGFADWETALINAAARSYFGCETRFATPGGSDVTSAGGMRVRADLALEAIDMKQADALIICGGTIWQTDAAPDLGRVAHAAKQEGRLIGAICDGVFALAKTGLLDDVQHTGNAPDQLGPTGYRGGPLYRNVPQAVTDQGIVTASGTAPVSFMAALAGALGFGGAELDHYVGLHAAQFTPRPAEA